MSPLTVVLIACIAALVSFPLGWFCGRRSACPRTDPTSRAPLPDEEFRRERERSISLYLESMKEYDRLVPWATAGTLVASITIVEKTDMRPGGPFERYLLGGAWVALFFALAASIGGAYFSTRTHSSTRRVLELAQKTSRTPEQDVELRRHERFRSWMGGLTKHATWLSGALMLLGIGLFGAFVFISL